MDRADFFHPGDQELIAQIQAGGTLKRKSEEELFSRFSYFIREGMQKHGLSEDDAFSAYSDTILAGIANLNNKDFQSRSSLKTYLFQIFHNKCVDLLRKKATNKNSVHRPDRITEGLMLLSDNARSILQNIMDRADWQALREKLQLLEEKCRFLLTYWSENYSDKEIAGFLSYKSADVAKTSRLRCLEKLRVLYNAI